MRKKSRNHWILSSAITSLESIHYLLKHLVDKDYTSIEYTKLQRLLLNELSDDTKVPIKSLLGARQHIKALEHLSLVEKYTGTNKKDIFVLSGISKAFVENPREIYTKCFFEIEFSKNNKKSEVDPSFNLNPGMFILNILFYLEKHYGEQASYLINDDFSHYLIFVKTHEEIVNIGEAIYKSHQTNNYPELPKGNSERTYNNHGSWIKALIKNTKYIQDHPDIRGSIKLNYKEIINDASNNNSVNYNLAQKILELFNYSDFKYKEYQDQEEYKTLNKINKLSNEDIKKLLEKYRKTAETKKKSSSIRYYIPMSTELKALVKKQANFTCQVCEKFSFKDKKGYGYCEPHHIITRAKSGEVDNPDNIVVLCPLCHAKIHHGDDNVRYRTYKALLKKKYIKFDYFEKLAKTETITDEQLKFLKKEKIITFTEFRILNKLKPRTITI